tara:strand:- start:346 stop:570 length:225 start_codon:yes stop_codon:yes gene_type:complete
MIIPVRCFTCNKVISSVYPKYEFLMEKKKNERPDTEIDQEDDIQKNLEIFQKIGIERYCCKRHLISHVDIIDKI